MRPATIPSAPSLKGLRSRYLWWWVVVGWAGRCSGLPSRLSHLWGAGRGLLPAVMCLVEGSEVGMEVEVEVVRVGGEVRR